MKATRKPRIKTVVVRVDSLRIHPTAQRDLVPARVRHIRQNLDLDAIGLLHAVEYEINGVTALWLLDGQHRQRALIDEGFGEWPVEVRIHLDCKTDARASELFLELQDRLSVNTWAKFDNHRKAGHADAVGVERIAQERNFQIGKATADGTISCVAALCRIYAADEGASLAKTLDTIVAAWGHGAPAIEGKLIEGLGIVFKTYNGQIEIDSLVRKLAKYPGGASALIGNARGLRVFRHNASLPRCVAERIIETYNAGRRAGKLDPL